MRAGRAALTALVGFALFGLMIFAGSAGADSPKSIYIVQMIDPPAVSYDGGVSGLAKTRPAKGAKIDPDSAVVKQYVGYLKGKHDKAIEKVGGGSKLYDFGYSFDGFAASLTAGQAAELVKQADVIKVTKNELVTRDTASTPSFLGLDAPGGLWSQLGGPDGTKAGTGAGEDIIIGDVDSGIWPESKSFSDRNASGKLIYQPINTSRWHGKKCAEGEEWDTDRCNKKLIGARYFNAAWGGNAALESQRPWEFMSPRDYNGHGTHTASTAGGNHGVQPTGPATVFKKTISGIAPRARIAAYKALWSTEDASTASGFTADLVAAIDQAVADGVDVINYSISGTTTNFLDPVEVAFLFAEDAGIVVSESAGNSGPTTGTVAHPGPWTITVAAGTHNRNGTGSVTLGNGATYNGASIAAAVPSSGLIDSVNAGLPGADPVKVQLCYSKLDNSGVAVLDPAKVAGKIVLCDRGVTGRVNKSLSVRDAGGVGMVLMNPTANSLNADFHFVPTVHVQNTDRTALKTYAGTANPTARINQSTIIYNDPAPFTAAFSSRGPLTAGGGDLLKPDVIAPGQDVLAAVAPPGQAGLEFNQLSGTSMSAPHVSGLAALLSQLHPDWTPMAVKSALMTSASDVLDGSNTDPVVIFRQGAGHVKPNSAADPGLVYDSGFNDFLAFLCGTTTGVSPATCSALKAAGYSLDASDFNSPSIAIGDMAGTQTVTRKVRNVGSSAATYASSVSGMSGITTVVTPSSLTLNPNQVGTFTVKFTRTSAPLNAYTGGQLTWTGAGHTVRSPIVIRPVALAAPRQVSSNGSAINYSVTFGYDGPFSATGRGLVAADKHPGTVADDPGDSFAPGGPGTKSFDVVVPAGTTYARFSLFNSATDGSDDLDLYVFRVSTNTQVGSSGGGSADEEVNLVNPAADTYRVWVHGFATDGPDSNFTLFNWVLGSAAAGNMTVTAPSTAVLGSTGTIGLTFSGLAPATKYLGSVAYSGISGLPNPTIVRVDTP